MPPEQSTLAAPAAEELISWVHEEFPLLSPGVTALDDGAGSGVVITALRARLPQIPILAADLSPGMLATIETKRLPNVKCQVVDTNPSEPDRGWPLHPLPSALS